MPRDRDRFARRSGGGSSAARISSMPRCATDLTSTPPVSTRTRHGQPAATPPGTRRSLGVAGSSHTCAAPAKGQRCCGRCQDLKSPYITPSCRARPGWSLARGWAASCVRRRRARSPPRRATCRKPDAENGGTASGPDPRRSISRVPGRPESDQPAKLDRITSMGRCGRTKSWDHGKSNHHCTLSPPAGHMPVFPCSPMTM